MSFDLAVWWEPKPITAQRAMETYRWLLGESDDSDFDVRPHDAVGVFARDLISRFPKLSDLTDDELETSPWAMDPHLSSSHVLMTISWLRADEVFSLASALATEHGLVMFDPQAAGVVQVNDLEPSPERPVLQMCDGSLVDTPSPVEVAGALGTLGKANWFAILEAGDEVYIQVGVGGSDGVGDLPEGWFNLERRDGDAERHYRHETENLSTVIRVFQGFAAGSADWAADVTWERMTF